MIFQLESNSNAYNQTYIKTFSFFRRLCDLDIRSKQKPWKHPMLNFLSSIFRLDKTCLVAELHFLLILLLYISRDTYIPSIMFQTLQSHRDWHALTEYIIYSSKSPLN